MLHNHSCEKGDNSMHHDYEDNITIVPTILKNHPTIESNLVAESIPQFSSRSGVNYFKYVNGIRSFKFQTVQGSHT